MTDPDTEGAWPPIPEEEMADFHRTADGFLSVANQLVGTEANDRIGAAFLYACARYNAFAMQAQTEDPSSVDAAIRDWLVARFETELRDHMLQQLRSASSAPPPPGASPDQALQVLLGLNALSTDARSAFLQLGDRFIHAANDLIQTEGVARTSAAMLHACTRFNAYVTQALGQEAGILDEDLIEDFCTGYANLLDFHLGQSLIASREQ